MKELSIEQKAKLYDKALEKARQLCAYPTSKPFISDLQDLFPELKENEESNDEEIRKVLLELISTYLRGNENGKIHGIYAKDILDWLEKQGKQKPVISNDALREGIAHFGITQYQIDNWLKKYVDVEKQGEQNLANSAKTCKIKPKFNEGDWVFIKDVKGYKNGPFQIKVVDSFGYSFDEYYTIPFMYEELLSKWTIQDAKDGDVLAAKTTIGYPNPFIAIYKEHGLNFFNSHCFVSLDGEFHEGTTGHSISDIHPAIKEQCDFLFQKMKEAGYKWDDEKKELKKIEQKPADNIESSTFKDKLLELFQRFRWYCKDKTPTNGEILEYVDAHIQELINIIQNNAWSEEDERMYRGLHNLIYSTPYCDSRKELSDWFESIKDRVQLKKEWSEEDEKYSSYICAALDAYYRLREEKNNTSGQEKLDAAVEWILRSL